MSDDPCTGDPVAWLLIEPGWRVVDRDGDAVGQVHDVLGDEGVDIFNGLAVKPGLVSTARYVPAERVRRITQGCVELDVDSAAFERLAEHTGATAAPGPGTAA